MQNRRGGSNQSDMSNSSLFIRAIMQGILLSALVTIVGSMLIGIVISLTDLDEASPSLQSINYLSVAVGGLLSGRIAGKAGWLLGGMVGVLYMLIVAVSLGGQGILAVSDPSFLLKLLGALIAGALGGMIGVNTR